MKIALLRQRVGGPGGAETTVQHLARGLAAAGHEVTVYGSQVRSRGPGRPGPANRLCAGARLGRQDRPAAHLCPEYPPPPAPAGPQVVFSLERTLGPQVYRAGDGCHREWLGGGLPSFLRRPESPSVSARFTGCCWPWSAASLPTPDSSGSSPIPGRCKEEIIRHYQVDPDRLRVIYNGLDRQSFQPLAEPERCRLCGPGWAPRPTRPLCFLPVPALTVKVWLFCSRPSAV